MDKQQLQTLKGFRDFLPGDMIIRNEVIERLRKIFESFGFDELQTPSLERAEVLTGKYGEEAEKLMYLFDDPGERRVGLRYDLTVPLARFMAGNPNSPKPFKRYQIQPVYRAENTQKGRYREIYQCDIDIVGSSSPLVDAEILAITNQVFSNLGFTGFKIKVNSRILLNDLLKKAKVPENLWTTTIISIDKLYKKDKSEVVEELRKKGLNKKNIEDTFAAFETAKPDDFLNKTIKYAQKMGVNNNLIFDPFLARGLDYYTGPIFETVVEKPKIGSLSGGGRYDKLLAKLGGIDLPATGTSFGLERIIDTINDLNLWPDVKKTNTLVLVTIFSEETLDSSLSIVNLLRPAGIDSELYPDPEVKLEKQLKYADKKGIPWAVIIGPDEILKNEVILKNLEAKTQETVSQKALLSKF